MRKYIIMGVQGSGKGTQAKMLAEAFDLVHIAVGDIFRWNVQNHTKIGAQVRRTMAAGSLVGDDLVEGVVEIRLREHDWNYGFIIDGFPRNERQAEFFLESYDIDGVIHLDLPDSEVARRVLARRLCADCGMDYNLLNHSPSSGATCDVCGGELIRREDDTEEALAVRLREYHAKTNPVLDIFRRKEFVITVDSRPAKEQVQQAIREMLGLRSGRVPGAGHPGSRDAPGHLRQPSQQPSGACRAAVVQEPQPGSKALASGHCQDQAIRQSSGSRGAWQVTPREAPGSAPTETGLGKEILSRNVIGVQHGRTRIRPSDRLPGTIYVRTTPGQMRQSDMLASLRHGAISDVG